MPSILLIDFVKCPRNNFTAVCGKIYHKSNKSRQKTKYSKQRKENRLHVVSVPAA
nr:MAG TPA: hypothetical protein [Caudoviricetes sp.]